ncbi:hypothetical protein [Pseudomonas viridiflava]|uniref:hypothetical protein n=1 Tax=Pseudomonas viridiflava TaxID=33069 RepID=UPI001C31B0E6|nr:hypothetical protein [Pseudomonas viridiflava]QXG34020.1 hypothetical protein KTT61_18275 [Pseudomonas viridiflava]
MNYENVLLIGGPSDGKRISVIAGVSHVQIARAEMLPPIFGSRNDPAYTATYEGATYHRYPIQSSHGLNTAVYVYGETDVLAALINGYRPDGQMK